MLFRSVEKELTTLLNNGHTNEILQKTEQIFQEMMQKKDSIQNVQMVCTDMISILTRIAKKNQISLDLVFKNSIKPNQVFTLLNTLPELQHWFIESFKHLSEQISLQFLGDSHYVRTAIACINRNFSNSISQQSVADEIGISVGYLSTIFKAETRQGFSDYLTSVRINTATQLLDMGETDLHKISNLCGFQDYAYFFKVFKKKMGVTPKNYIQSMLNK